MSQKERSNWRDNYFPSQWHRAPRFPKEYLLTDIDAVEWRKNQKGFYEPVGLFEYKIMWKFLEQINYIEQNNRLSWQLHFLKEIAFRCHVPAYFVGYEYGDEPYQISKVSLFNILSWQKDTKPKIEIMGEWEYREWLKRIK